MLPRLGNDHFRPPVQTGVIVAGGSIDAFNASVGVCFDDSSSFDKARRFGNPESRDSIYEKPARNQFRAGFFYFYPTEQLIS